MRSLLTTVRSSLSGEGRLVAVDGVDGSGKTSFAADLIAEIRDRPAIVVHADHFLNPSRIRYAKGRHSPEGFWADTYDHAALRERVLRPLGRGGNGWYSPASYDPVADRTTPAKPIQAPADALVLVEGMVLHRHELASFWEVTRLHSGQDDDCTMTSHGVPLLRVVIGVPALCSMAVLFAGTSGHAASSTAHVRRSSSFR